MIERLVKRANLHYSGLIFIATLKRLYRTHKSDVIFMFIVYLIGAASIILANVDYLDDSYRTLGGSFGFGWHRYTSELAARVLQLHPTFQLNIFPYSILISILLLSISSCLLVHIITPRLAHSKLALLASITVGLSPYYLESLSYKFDSPFMALSVLVSIFPFLFVRHMVLFIVVSIICVFMMITSYQASSGIHMMLTVLFIFKYLTNNISLKQISLKIILPATFSYAFALAIFSQFYMQQDAYVGTTLPDSPDSTYAMITSNIIDYFITIYDDFCPNVFIYIIIALPIIFIANKVLDSPYKIRSFIISIFVFIVLALLSPGLFLIINHPPFEYPRGFIGFGVLIAILMLESINIKQTTILRKSISVLFILVLVESCMVFANYYGQALKNDMAYGKWRLDIALQDVFRFKPLAAGEKIKIAQSLSSVGLPPAVQQANIHYPIIKKLLPMSRKFWNQDFIKKYYGIYPYQSCSTDKEIDRMIGAYHDIIEYEDENGKCFVIMYKNDDDIQIVDMDPFK